VVLEVKTDPNVPPLPPHVTAAQTKAFLAAYLKGDRALGKVIRRKVAEAF
jgi:pyruvate dehydrogenase (quinone)